jgi:dTDP-4-amino-4,6-dideoxygalactose transaminase
MAQGIYKITEEFERLVAEYTGAPYAIGADL